VTNRGRKRKTNESHERPHSLNEEKFYQNGGFHWGLHVEQV
jgi:hypothetical protein